MNTLLQKIADHNNLYWAWEKAKNSYKPGDIWFNELEVAAFEANLSEELASIHYDILNGLYQLKAIEPVAYPKGRDDNGPRTRQTFWVSVRDQVAWLAVVNIIGRYIDSKMPFWSYGNRLYISMFYDEDKVSGLSELKFGYYRNTTRNFFRKWSQSWPLYRRHINVTAKYLTKDQKEFNADLEVQEQQMIEQNNKLIDHPLKAGYLDASYWKTRKKDGLYWAGLDLEKFYPQISLAIIKENLSKYLPTSYNSEQFVALIDSLLNFQIDLIGWNKDELSAIGLNEIEKNYHHLPTGLFVAGFLANVALLQVDEQIQAKLNINRNIAHFRYVDDHVLLSTTFEGLLEWIEDYQRILDKSNIGTTFNPAKTEPKGLADYYTCLKSDDQQDILKYKAEAKKQTALDPDFPSPLMTQTLGKVSKIAGTAFNLLSPEEERSLIADIEHLLVTEFPDHELRKDTRVSFAARMLSTLVPQVMADSNEAYRLHRNLCLKTTAIKDTEEEIRKANHKPTSKAKLEGQLLGLKLEEKDYQVRLKAEELRLKNEEERLAARTIKLLLKAVQDNHDKVRLWSRLLEFFLKSGAGKPKVIFAEIKKLKDREETNVLSLTFIHSLILQVLCALLFDVVRILSHNNSSQKKKQRALSFLKNLYDSEIFNYFDTEISGHVKKYEGISQQMFRFTAGAVLAIVNNSFLSEKEKLDEKLVLKHGLVDFKDSPTGFINHTPFTSGVWAWWFYHKMSEPRSGEPPFLWETINASLDYKLPIDLNVALLYPKQISVVLLTRLNQLENTKLTANEGFLYDVYKRMPEEVAAHFAILHRVAKKCRPLAKFLTVDDWILWMSNKQRGVALRENEPLIFDPRLGEWAALEMIRQIAEEIKEKAEELGSIPGQKHIEYFRYIHPNNFKLPREWIDDNDTMTWENLTRLLGEGSNMVSFRAVDDLIMDNRFIPQFGLDQDNENQAILHATGSLLVALLSKNTDLPSRWNPVGQQQAGLNLAKFKLKNLAISTYTRDIISACFSNRNLETQFNLSFDKADFEFADDTSYDPPIFRIIDDFIRQVEFALNKLKNQQLSVSSHQPRQLTPISIMQLRREDYQTLMENSEVD
jgi:hypothetical protein